MCMHALPRYTCRAMQIGTPEKYTGGGSGERKSRIRGMQQERESGDGMDAADMATASSPPKLSFSNLGMQAESLEPFYGSRSKDSVDSHSET